MMRGTDKDHWPITRDVECTAGAYLSEEYLGDYPPEYQSRFICDLGHFGDGASASYEVLCEKGHEGEKGNEVSSLQAFKYLQCSGLSVQRACFVNTAKFNSMIPVGIHADSKLAIIITTIFCFHVLVMCILYSMSGNRSEREMKV